MLKKSSKGECYEKAVGLFLLYYFNKEKKKKEAEKSSYELTKSLVEGGLVNEHKLEFKIKYYNSRANENDRISKKIFDNLCKEIDNEISKEAYDESDRKYTLFRKAFFDMDPDWASDIRCLWIDIAKKSSLDPKDYDEDEFTEEDWGYMRDLHEDYVNKSNGKVMSEKEKKESYILNDEAIKALEHAKIDKII